ncbi:MAG TPA: DUF6599 family protein [Acidobacteriota bacterium]|nr:DUF6599 family protein [Acidobacteriota bacterium]
MQSYSRWRLDDIRLEVFETPDPAGAYQLFRLWPTLRGQDVRRLSNVQFSHLLVDDRLLVWRGNFLLSLSGSSSAELVQTASRLSQLIRVENELPVTTTHLPSQGMVAGSDQFYLGPEALALNSSFPEPLLETIGLQDHIEVASARYEPDGRSLFLIGYPTVDLARRYSVEIQDRLHDFFVDEGLYMKRSGLLIALFDGPWEQAESVLTAVQYRPRIEWIEDRDPRDEREGEVRTFFGMLTKTFIGIGAALLMAMGAGIVVGLARYEFLRRFPTVGGRREMIRLKLDRDGSGLMSAGESSPDFASTTRSPSSNRPA